MAEPKFSHSEDIPKSFKHQRLASETSIRVLELLPGRKSDAQLQISLKQMELGDAWDNYEAVSYVWGSVDGSYPIYCHGRQILITPNCRDVLFHLRHENKVRLLWVDSICIDQTVDGDLERVLQIQLMGQIYHQARCVLVWLGQDDQRMRVLFRYLQYFGRISMLEDRAFDMRQHRIGSALSEVIGFWGLVSLYIYKGYAGTKTQNSHQSAFLHLLRSPWFLRAWTVQEVAASRHCTVMYGELSIPWKVFTSRGFTQILFNLREDDFIMITGRIAAAKLFNYYTDISKATSRISNKRASMLSTDLSSRKELDLLRLIRHLMASRPEDKVYSLYSIFTLSSIPLSKPDYKKPAHQVLEDFALGYIHSRKSLALLAITLPPDENSTLPSWVPDWLTPPRPDTHEEHVNNNLLKWFHFFKDFKASNRQEPITALQRIPSRLVVRARRVARVKSVRAIVSSKPVKDSQVWQMAEEILPSCQKWVWEVNNMRWQGIYESHDALIQSALKTINFPYTSFNEEKMLFWFDVMLFPNCRRVTKAEIEKAAGKPTEDDLSSDEILLRLQRAGRRSFANTLASRFTLKQISISNGMPYYLVTLEDSRFGMVYRNLEPDDEIFILAGANMPFVLRHKGTDRETNIAMYKVVSPAFIQGAMHGELWPSDVKETKDIILV